MEYAPVLITGAANTVAEASVWFSVPSAEGDKELLAYALSNGIALVDMVTKQVLLTLRPKEQEERINAIVCVPSINSDAVLLLCGGDKGFIHIWQLSWPTALEHTLIFSTATGGYSISSLTACSTSLGMVAAAANTQGTLFVWRMETLTTDLYLLCTQRFPPAQMPNAIHLTNLSPDAQLLVVGSVDARVHLLVLAGSVLTPAGQLTGHEEWITCIATIQHEQVIYMATGSQDNKIRLWRICAGTDTPTAAAFQEPTAEDEEEDEAEEGQEIAPQVFDEDDDKHRHEARCQFTADGRGYLVFLEALLVGHDDWVTAVHWMPCSSTLRLFSTSMDRNMVIWAEQAGVWVPSVRLGDMGGALGGAIAGNLLGFVSGQPAPTGNGILGVGYGGSFHLWRSAERWAPEPLLSGHFNAVQDIQWNDTGAFLLSVSHDQTCRLFAPTDAAHAQRWVEVSRPEMHGYDLNTCMLSADGCQVFTGGEEKLIRVFEMPQIVRNGLLKLCGVQLEGARPARYARSSNAFPCVLTDADRAEQAYIPELGLSNKGRDLMSSQEVKEQEARGVAAVDWRQPPLESQLADHTLWLETQKLFGHNNDVLAMASSPDRLFMASSSKARFGAACVLLLWKLRESDQQYETVGLLPGHESTVVCLQFSPDSNLLATSGKDRRLCLYARNNTGFDHIVALGNAHKRIIWDLSWCPDGHLLVTASRDGSCKLWHPSVAGSSLTCVGSFMPFASQPVTAIAFHPSTIPLRGAEVWLIAVGAESGHLQLWSLPTAKAEEYLPSALASVSESYAHTKAVKRIRWRPAQALHDDNDRIALDWASCGDDHTVRIHRSVV